MRETGTGDTGLFVTKNEAMRRREIFPVNQTLLGDG